MIVMHDSIPDVFRPRTLEDAVRGAAGQLPSPGMVRLIAARYGVPQREVLRARPWEEDGGAAALSGITGSLPDLAARAARVLGVRTPEVTDRIAWLAPHDRWGTMPGWPQMVAATIEQTWSTPLATDPGIVLGRAEAAVGLSDASPAVPAPDGRAESWYSRNYDRAAVPGPTPPAAVPAGQALASAATASAAVVRAAVRHEQMAGFAEAAAADVANGEGLARVWAGVCHLGERLGWTGAECRSIFAGRVPPAPVTAAAAARTPGGLSPDELYWAVFGDVPARA
jgi:hypothetical protein